MKIRCKLDLKLHAHAKGKSYFVKANATRNAREMGRLLALAADGQAIEGPAIVDYTFFVPDRRRRDEANMIQSCKGTIDGVVDSGKIIGDHWEVLSTGIVTVVLGGVDAVEVELNFRAKG